jgi:RNA polymerase sigma factor (TIGR02999 family)
MAPSHREPGHPSADPAADPRASGGEVTRCLARLREGDRAALDLLVPLLYDELRRLARERLRGERPGHTLETTALVHEAYFRLLEQRRIDAGDRLDFFAVASNTMRRVLIDHARARKRQKRGGGAEAVPLDDVPGLLSDRAADEALAVDAALDRLAADSPRAARVVELRIFGGLTLEEIATVLDVSAKTVQRDWEAARAWLRKEIRGELPGDGDVRDSARKTP